MDRIEYLKTTKYPSVESDIIDKAVSADPTLEKKFTDWIIRMIVKSGLKVQELPQVKSALSSYNSIRNRLPQDQRDINRFSTPLELSVLVMEFIRSETKGDSKDPLMVYDKIYEDERWLVIKPYTYEASVKYSKSTKWCTAARPTFYSYMSRGFMYILIDKTLSDGESKAKMQFQFASGNGQFMDSLDQAVDVLDFLAMHKPIWDAFLKHGEFENGNCKMFKLIHNPGNVDPETQMAGWRWMRFKIFDILKNPCAELQNSAIESIIESDAWHELGRIGKLTPDIQNIIIDKAIRVAGRNSGTLVIKAFLHMETLVKLDGRTPGLSMDVALKFAEACPTEVFRINNPSDEMLEIAFSHDPKLITKKLDDYKIGDVRRRWFVDMAVKVPDTLKYIYKSVELTGNDVERIFNSRKFEVSRHIEYLKNIPEKIQLIVLRKYGVGYFKHFKNPTERVRIRYKKLKKRYDAKEREIRKRQNNKAELSWQNVVKLFQGSDGKWVLQQVTDSDGKYRIIQRLTTDSGLYTDQLRFVEIEHDDDNWNG